MSDFIPRAGAVRAPDSDGDWIMVNPGDPLFSTVTMTATQFWNGEEWVDIFPPDEDGQS